MIGLGLAASILLFVLVYHLERASNEARFRELADQRINAVRINVASALDTVTVLAGHFEISPPDTTSREDFRRLVWPVIQSHPFIQALEWIPKVENRQRQSFEAAGRKDGIADFQFTERNPEKTLVPAQSRPVYFPVFYVQPVVGNVKAQGYDLASDPTRRAALEAASTSGTLTATARINLVQEQGDQYGVLVFAPVFQGPISDLSARQHSLIGYVLGVFRIGDFVAKTWTANQSDVSAQMVDIHLFDQSAPADQQVLYPKNGAKSLTELSTGLVLSTTFDMAGRQWKMVASPGPDFKSAPVYSLGIFAVSLLALLFYLFYLRSNMHRAEAAAHFGRQANLAKQRLTEAQRIALVGYIEFDGQSQTWGISDDCKELLGLERSVTSSNIADILVNADPEDAAALYSRLADNGTLGMDMELRIGERVLHVMGENEQGSKQREDLLLTIQDITRRRAAAVERENMIQRIAEVSRMEALGTLAGGIAHEINTPTQFVSDNLQFLKDGVRDLLDYIDTSRSGDGGPDLSAKLAAMDYDFLKSELPLAADQAMEGTERIAKIVQAVKEFSYPTSKIMHPVDLNRLIEMVSIVTRNQWKYVAEMEFNLAPDLPHIQAIEGEINQVLVNLIVNAAYAIGERHDGTPGRITMTTRATDKSMVELSISDTGIGIPPENLRKIFEMFFTTKPPGQGTGQGLAITHSIIRHLGGGITVHSEPENGATFTITLPVARHDEQQVFTSESGA